MICKASGRLKTTSVMQTLSGLSGRLSQRGSDLNPPPGMVEREEGVTHSAASLNDALLPPSCKFTARP